MTATQPIHLVRPQALHASSERWSVDAVEALFELPFNDLLFRAQQVHREHFDANAVQRSTLLSIKTGGCPEDCGYCPQSAHHDTGVEADKLMDLATVRAAAQAAVAAGASRFCMGAAWREPKDRDIEKVVELIRRVSVNRTVLMVEHNLNVVANLSDTITVLTRGQILAEGDYATVSANKDVQQAYMGSGHG